MTQLDTKQKIGQLIPHTKECLDGQRQLKDNLKLYHPEHCLEPERIKLIDQLYSLYQEGREETLVEVGNYLKEKLAYLTYSDIIDELFLTLKKGK